MAVVNSCYIGITPTMFADISVSAMSLHFSLQGAVNMTIDMRLVILCST